MRAMAAMGLVFCVLVSTSLLAQEVTCESNGSARNECEMDTRGVVKMVQQLSRSPCREGTDWGLSKHGVWVENGCRAVFVNAGTADRGPPPGASSSTGEVTCESNDGARNECEMNTRGEVRLVRQLSRSPCREGTDWGLSKHGVWVENGCRAVFANASDRGRDDRYDRGRDERRTDDRPRPPHRGLPTFNANCPLRIQVHGDEGGYIYINGDQATVKKINDGAYDATRGSTTISITLNPDETLNVMYTRGNDGGICQVE